VSCKTQGHRTGFGELGDAAGLPRTGRQRGGDAAGRWSGCQRGVGNTGFAPRTPTLALQALQPPVSKSSKALNFTRNRTPKCSQGVTHKYNRESVSVERRSNCNLTGINFCARITRHYHQLPTEDCMSDLKTTFISQLKILIVLALYSQGCVLLRTNCQIPARDHSLRGVCPGDDHRPQRVKPRAKRLANGSPARQAVTASNQRDGVSFDVNAR